MNPGGTVTAGTVSPGTGARRRVRRTVTAVLLGVLTMAGLTACGDSSSDSAPATSAAAGTEKASAATTAKAATGVTTTTGAATPATTAAGGSSNASDLGKQLVAAFNAAAKGDCAKAQAIGDSMDLDAQSGNFALGNFEALAVAMKDLSSSGPSEIRSDLKILADAFGALVAVYKKYGINDLSQIAAVASDPAKMAEVSAALKVMQDPKVVAANTAISAWVDKKCPGMNAGKG